MEEFKTFIDQASIDELVQIYNDELPNNSASAYSLFIEIAKFVNIETDDFINPSNLLVKCGNPNFSIAQSVLGGNDDIDNNVNNGYGWDSLNDEQKVKFFATAKKINDNLKAMYYNQDESLADIIKLDDLNDNPDNIIDMKALNIFTNLHSIKWGMRSDMYGEVTDLNDDYGSLTNEEKEYVQELGITQDNLEDKVLEHAIHGNRIYVLYDFRSWRMGGKRLLPIFSQTEHMSYRYILDNVWPFALDSYRHVDRFKLYGLKNGIPVLEISEIDNFST